MKFIVSTFILVSTLGAITKSASAGYTHMDPCTVEENASPYCFNTMCDNPYGPIPGSPDYDQSAKIACCTCN